MFDIFNPSELGKNLVFYVLRDTTRIKSEIFGRTARISGLTFSIGSPALFAQAQTGPLVFFWGGEGGGRAKIPSGKKLSSLENETYQIKYGK